MTIVLKLYRRHQIIVLFLILIFVTRPSFSQTNKINQIDANGLRQGYWERYKEVDGKKFLAEKGSYLNNEKNGTWTEFYGNGNKKMF